MNTIKVVQIRFGRSPALSRQITIKLMKGSIPLEFQKDPFELWYCEPAGPLEPQVEFRFHFITKNGTFDADLSNMKYLGAVWIQKAWWQIFQENQ